MPNRLAGETSPYLLQHAENPVDWYPWGPEALEKARRENKPIFLSIGYSACHWCHVMEHESFEDPEIARLMNEHFVCVKVDREERPDLDQIYMQAVQLLTRHGGWPMSVFLTPEGKPFYGGTYWPPEDRMGMPGFKRVLTGVAEAWKGRREEIEKSAGELTGAIQQIGTFEPAAGVGGIELLEKAYRGLHGNFDQSQGGFGHAPKFPHAMDVRFLLRWWKRTTSTTDERSPASDRSRAYGGAEALHMVELTLDRMARGGIYDQLGGGFHRYVVDQRWLVPHFEKMLYDNALLVPAYLEAYQATGKQEYARVARETLDYLLREMTSPEGGFYSTQDADSEGEEGKFYVWTESEVREVLGDELARVFNYYYDVTPEGNWEGKSILNRPKTHDQTAKLLNLSPDKLEHRLAEARAKLLEVRNRRVWPGRDEKVIVAWNGMAIAAFAQAAQVLGEPRYAEAAARAAEFILTNMRGDAGGLLHTYKDGRARFPAYLDDYACLIDGLVELYQATFEPRHLTAAVELAEAMVEQFWDPGEHAGHRRDAGATQAGATEVSGGFFYTPGEGEALIARTKDVQDSSTPSGNAMAATALVKLGKLTGRTDLLEKAEGTLRLLTRLMEQAPTMAGQALIALDFYVGPSRELAIVAPDTSEAHDLARSIFRRFLPNRVVALRQTAEGHRRDAGATAEALPAPLAGLFEGKEAQDGRLTLYVCENFACREPVVGVQAAKEAVERL